MNQSVAIANDAGEIMESVIAKGDLARLSPEERSSYYMQVCRSIGLNPLTRPFEYITLQGKMTLYTRRDAADQLRKLNGISIEIVSKSVDEGILTVHVRAKDKTGRTDEDYGVVSVAGLKGDVAANAFLKAVTKAKRRVTLSISGLGWLDETEIETIADAHPVTSARKPPAPQPSLIVESGAPNQGDTQDHTAAGHEAATKGQQALDAWWASLPNPAKKTVPATERAKMKATAQAKPPVGLQEEDVI